MTAAMGIIIALAVETHILKRPPFGPVFFGVGLVHGLVWRTLSSPAWKVRRRVGRKMVLFRIFGRTQDGRTQNARQHTTVAKMVIIRFVIGNVCLTYSSSSKQDSFDHSFYSIIVLPTQGLLNTTALIIHSTFSYSFCTKNNSIF